MVRESNTLLIIVVQRDTTLYLVSVDSSKYIAAACSGKYTTVCTIIIRIWIVSAEKPPCSRR